MTDIQKERWRLVGGIALSLAALAFTAGALWYAVPPAAGAARDVGAKLPVAVILALWAVAPPIWFLVEWAFLRPADPDGPDAKAMIRSQELASKIWAGVLVALGLLYAVKVGGAG